MVLHNNIIWLEPRFIVDQHEIPPANFKVHYSHHILSKRHVVWENGNAEGRK
jgi:hypothetical protein